MEIKINEIENNYIAQKINKIQNTRVKGHIRQVEILKFLSIWKYATIEQLAALTGTTKENLYKHIHRLKKLSLIGSYRYMNYSIVEITTKGLYRIEETTGISYEFLKTKDRFQKTTIEHDLLLRSLAIQMYMLEKTSVLSKDYDNIQLPVKTSHWLRLVYKTLKNKIGEIQAKNIVKKIHLADFVLLKQNRFFGTIIVGIEYENSYKQLKDVRRKLKSLKESLGFYNCYYFIFKNDNIKKSFTNKLIKASHKLDADGTVYEASNLSGKIQYIHETKYDKNMPNCLKKDIMKIMKIRKLNI